MEETPSPPALEETRVTAPVPSTESWNFRSSPANARIGNNAAIATNAIITLTINFFMSYSLFLRIALAGIRGF